MFCILRKQSVKVSYRSDQALSFSVANKRTGRKHNKLRFVRGGIVVGLSKYCRDLQFQGLKQRDTAIFVTEKNEQLVGVK